MTFQAYHGVTGAQHQTHFNNLQRAGLSDDLAERLRRSGRRAVRRRVGAARRARPGWPSTASTAPAINPSSTTGRRRATCPVLVSATGTAGNAIFAAVFEQGIVGTVVRPPRPDLRPRHERGHVPALRTRPRAIEDDPALRRHLRDGERSPLRGRVARESAAS